MAAINEDPFTIPEDFYYLDFFLRQVGEAPDADWVGVVNILQELSVSEHVFFDPQHAVDAYQLVLMKLLEQEAASDVLQGNKRYYYALANNNTEDTWRAFEEGFSRGLILSKSSVLTASRAEVDKDEDQSAGEMIQYEFINGYLLNKRYGKAMAKKHLDFFGNGFRKR